MTSKACDDLAEWFDQRADLDSAHSGSLKYDRWNEEKDKGRDEPLQALEFLGMMVDARAGSVYLTEEKKIAYRQELSDIREKFLWSSTK